MSLALDGSAHGGGSSANSASTGTLTTSAGSGVIVAMVLFANNGGATVSSVTATGLTFTARPGGTYTNASNTVVEYTAPYTTNFSGAVTVNLTGGPAFLSILAFGVGGAATNSFFDANGAVPAIKSTTNAVSAAISTNNANDFLYLLTLPGSGSDTFTDSQSANWTVIYEDASTLFLGAAYRIVSATVSGLTVTDNTNAMVGSLVDAIIQAPAGGGGGSSTLSMVGVGHHKHIGWTPLMDRRAKVRYHRRLWRWNQ